MTNIEKIKSMSVEEMSEFFSDHNMTCDFCLNNTTNGGQGCKKGCLDGITKYLMSEVADND